MARKGNPWLVAGIGVGVSLAGFFLYRALTTPTVPATSSTTASKTPLDPTADACSKAALLASVGHAAEYKSYLSWAAICRQGGGNPPPFPGA
jgi:hypothetical protein